MTSNNLAFRRFETFGRLLLLLSLFSIQAFAHDCFLMAKPYRLKQGGTMHLAMHITETFPGKHIAWNPDRITRFHLWHGRTLLESVVPEPMEDSSGVSVNITQSGTHFFAVDRAASTIELSGEEFTKYLRSEGLDHILKLRKEGKEENKPGRERYSRYLKAFVKVGEADPDLYRPMTIGQTLEIVPLNNPTALKVGDTLRVRLLYRGAAVVRAKISATYAGATNKADTYAQTLRTDKNGLASFKLTHVGPWLIRTVHMLPVESEDVDWESWWASITFEIS